MKKKRVFAGILVMSAVMLCYGCGSAKGSETKPEETPAETTTSTVMETPEETTVPTETETSEETQKPEETPAAEETEGDAEDNASVNDPFDLYSWDEGTNSYIPYQQAESDGSPIGKGSGWFYYDEESDSYLPW
ncbi:MAG: hypothetical protein PHS82_09885 [Lachnospiraceae bacterium]|nr:hypothetical protein [Lachnospiraceae bacterium]